MIVSEKQLEIARIVCTERQLAVVELRARGAGWKLIAVILGVSKSTVREHWDAAEIRIARAEVTRGSLVA